MILSRLSVCQPNSDNLRLLHGFTWNYVWIY